ncbi:MAG TPA: hypothetical protein VHD33_08390, partial [Legionellaceae bacterium]|nr:hypothetical protein [Legionellaceae bacterium]
MKVSKKDKSSSSKQQPMVTIRNPNAVANAIIKENAALFIAVIQSEGWQPGDRCAYDFSAEIHQCTVRFGEALSTLTTGLTVSHLVCGITFQNDDLFEERKKMLKHLLENGWLYEMDMADGDEESLVTPMQQLVYDTSEFKDDKKNELISMVFEIASKLMRPQEFEAFSAQYKPKPSSKDNRINILRRHIESPATPIADLEYEDVFFKQIDALLCDEITEIVENPKKKQKLNQNNANDNSAALILTMDETPPLQKTNALDELESIIDTPQEALLTDTQTDVITNHEPIQTPLLTEEEVKTFLNYNHFFQSIGGWSSWENYPSVKAFFSAYAGFFAPAYKPHKEMFMVTIEHFLAFLLQQWPDRANRLDFFNHPHPAELIQALYILYQKPYQGSFTNPVHREHFNLLIKCLMRSTTFEKQNNCLYRDHVIWSLWKENKERCVISAHFWPITEEDPRAFLLNTIKNINDLALAETFAYLNETNHHFSSWLITNADWNTATPTLFITLYRIVNVIPTNTSWDSKKQYLGSLLHLELKQIMSICNALYMIKNKSTIIIKNKSHSKFFNKNFSILYTFLLNHPTPYEAAAALNIQELLTQQATDTTQQATDTCEQVLSYLRPLQAQLFPVLLSQEQESVDLIKTQENIEELRNIKKSPKAQDYSNHHHTSANIQRTMLKEKLVPPEIQVLSTPSSEAQWVDYTTKNAILPVSFRAPVESFYNTPPNTREVYITKKNQEIHYFIMGYGGFQRNILTIPTEKKDINDNLDKQVL